MNRRIVLGFLLLFAELGLGVSRVAARPVRVPMRLDYAFVNHLLAAQVYRDPGRTARVWDDGSGCNFLILSEPVASPHEGKLRVSSKAVARVGTGFGEQCLTLIDFTGRLDVVEQPMVSVAAPIVRFQVVDSNLYDAQGKKPLVTGTIWDWVKKHAHPRLEDLKIDLTAPMSDLRGALPLFLEQTDAARVQRLVDTLNLAEVAIQPDGVELALTFEAGEQTPAAGTPEPTLSPEELQRFETAFPQWDAFLTFVVKGAAGDTAVEELRRALLEVLLDGRHDILEALLTPRPAGEDPVRRLFLRSWGRLAPVLRSLSAGLPGETALRYLSFIAAADALQGIDDLGPDTGLEISADGLRRLARIIAPAATVDPLLYDVAIDPELRRLFGFGPPLEPPEDNPEIVASTAPSPAAGPCLSRATSRRLGCGPGASIHRFLSAWIASPAVAAIEPDKELLSRLNRWAPSSEDVDTYLPLVKQLLDSTIERTQRDRNLAMEFRDIYRNLTLATAWQESCWRQFVRDGNQLKPIRSAVGSVGLMQVNVRVWRGFYDGNGLHRDIGYNARAGAEILIHYLVDYAIKKGEHATTNSIDNLARATYAIYNGGPGHIARYRKPTTPKSLAAIDRAFWEKYLTVKGGDPMGVMRCYR